MSLLRETIEVPRLEGKGATVHVLDDIGFAPTPHGTRVSCTVDISLLGRSASSSRH